MSGYRAPTSNVWHQSRDCHALDGSADVERVDPDETDLRRCESCGYDHVPALEDAPDMEGRA